MVIRVVHSHRNPLICNSLKVDRAETYAIENKGKCYALRAYQAKTKPLNLKYKS